MPMPPIPDASAVREALKALTKAWRTYKGYRLLVFGTKAVGKTTLWRHLESGKEVQASISTTLAPEEISKFKLKDIKFAWIRTRVLGVDVPGDQNLRSTWEDTLYRMDAPTHGIIFMLDHIEDTARGVPAIGYDQARLEEHYRAFEHLSNLIFNKADVADNLQALLVLVNKNDHWPGSLQFGQIIKASGLDRLLTRFNDLPHCRVRVQPCSALYGSNVQGSIAWMAKNFDRL
jgi:hypothetical protein